MLGAWIMHTARDYCGCDSPERLDNSKGSLGLYSGEWMGGGSEAILFNKPPPMPLRRVRPDQVLGVKSDLVPSRS